LNKIILELKQIMQPT